MIKKINSLEYTLYKERLRELSIFSMEKRGDIIKTSEYLEGHHRKEKTQSYWFKIILQI